MSEQQNAAFPLAIKALAGRLANSLSAIRLIPGLVLELRGPDRTEVVVTGGQTPRDSDLSVVRLPVGAVPGFEFLLSGVEGPVFELAVSVVRAQLDQMESERREELLLDELGANWESLEALYEISNDVLRFGDVNTALHRLIDRLVSLQDGLRACLLLGKDGKLERIVSSAPVPARIEWQDLGPIESAIRECRSTMTTQPVAWPTTRTLPGEVTELPWCGSTMVAAAPLTSRREKVIGLVLVWREDRRFIFDAPFSRLLEAIAYQASILMESDRLNRTMRENQRLAQEIEIASSIQHTLLMGHPPVGIPMLQIASCSRASQRIDGDFHDFLRHGDAVDVLVGDVMGKGVAAALLGAATKSQFLRAIANLSLRGFTPSPVQIVSRTASRLNEQLIAVERFVTLSYARFNPRESMLEFVDCGHTGILRHRKKTNETVFLRGDDLPLGVSHSLDFQQRSASMMPGDTFLLFSDGVTETRNPENQLFGEERLIEALETWSSLGPEILLRQIMKVAEEFRKSVPNSDDFTCIAIRVVHDTETEIPARYAAEFCCDLEQLEHIRQWLSDLSQAAGVGPDRMLRLKTAAQEAFVNCIRHGSTGDSIHAVFLDAEIYSTHVRLRISHEGPAFDPLAVPLPAFDGSRDSGFGTFIIMRSADELEYLREGDLNSIIVSIFRGGE